MYIYDIKTNSNMNENQNNVKRKYFVKNAGIATTTGPDSNTMCNIMNINSLQCNNSTESYMKYFLYENSWDRLNINIQDCSTNKLVEQKSLSYYTYKHLLIPLLSKMQLKQLKCFPPRFNSFDDCFESSPANENNVICRMGFAHSMLPIFDSKNTLEASKRFLDLSRIPENCKDLRRSGCIALLVHMLCSESDEIVCKRVNMAIHNIIYNHSIEKSARRETKILRLLEQLIAYCKFLKDSSRNECVIGVDSCDIPVISAVSSLMKVSFDEEHRQSMCILGALQVISNVLYLDYAGSNSDCGDRNSFRRYALMALTNLTFGDEINKSILCKQKEFMEILVAQLGTAPDDLLQVTASLLRNLSWRADNHMKIILNKIGSVTALVHAAMKNRNENTLKSILSALWNLSAHCSKNKAEFCAVDGALAFLVGMLTYESPSKTLKIVENAGGILRNVSSHIAIREDYRQILREGNCLLILLQHLKSESLTVVSNSCGSLWNLSARCHEDQQFLWNNGAVSMLRSLVHSKHAMISEGSSAALKNLLNFRSSLQSNSLNSPSNSIYLKRIPILTAKKRGSAKESQQKATPPQIQTTENGYFTPSLIKRYGSKSLDSITSSQSDSVYENYKYFPKSLSKYKSNSLDCIALDRLKTKNTFRSAKYEDSSVRSYNYSILPSDISEIGILTTTTITSEKQFKRSIEMPNYVSSSYQETDLDQLTNFSLRYAENQIESDIDAATSIVNCSPNNHYELRTEDNIHPQKTSKGNEILLILEDSVKCYQTEDTPYMTSNATSVNDLTSNKTDNTQLTVVPKLARGRKCKKSTKHKTMTSAGSGFETPENPISYCEEGTPDGFSRHESFNSLLDVPSSHTTNTTKPIKKLYNSDENQIQKKNEYTCNLHDISEKVNISHLNKPRINSAQETPLMFSRRSSIDSLREVDVATYDDISSIQSDISRLASGVISPSDIPDSPTQIITCPPPPVKISEQIMEYPNILYMNGKENQEEKMEQCQLHQAVIPPASNVFEDNLNTFNVENTPAQFSCATSLSNLSSVEEDTHLNYQSKLPLEVPQNISEGEEEETHRNYDELLLASCIDIGMNRITNSGLSKTDFDNRVQHIRDEIVEYFTEDTPALFSNEGSNTNLSVISIASSKNDQNDNIALKSTNNNVINETNIVQHSLNNGLHLPTIKTDFSDNKQAVNNCVTEIVPVTATSVLLSSKHPLNKSKMKNTDRKQSLKNQPAAGADCIDSDNQWMNNSLSSLSIDSDDDNHLLSQTIAAGYNRPKSNLGFIGPDANKHINLVSTSHQINARHTRPCSMRHSKKPYAPTLDVSYSSNDSSDSNDNQSKSLLELCIRTGMHKSQSCNNVKQKCRKKYANNQMDVQLIFTQSNPNLVPLQKKRKSSKAKTEKKLLMECIYAGITTKTGHNESTKASKRKTQTSKNGGQQNNSIKYI